MELNTNKLYLDMCEFFLALGSNLTKVTREYQEEIKSDSKMIEKRMVSILKIALKTISNILAQCDIYINGIGKEQLELLDCYQKLLKYINIYKRLLNDNCEVHKSVQTGFCNDDSEMVPISKKSEDVAYPLINDNASQTKNDCGLADKEDTSAEHCEVLVEIIETDCIKQELDGYESEETVLFERDTRLDDTRTEENIPLEAQQEDSYSHLVTPAQADSSSENDSFIFVLNSDAQVSDRDGADDIQLRAEANVCETTTPSREKTPDINPENAKPNHLEAKIDDGRQNIKEEDTSIFDKSTQILENITTTIKKDENTKTKISERVSDDNSNLLRLCVEHESDFEEDDDYYQLKNDDLRDSDLMSETELEDFNWVEASDHFSGSDDSLDGEVSNFSEYTQKKCVVNIKRLPESTVQKLLAKAKENSEPKDVTVKTERSTDNLLQLIKEIDQIADFSTLKRPKKRCNESKAQKGVKRLKTQGSASMSDESSESEIWGSSSDNESFVSELEQAQIIGYEDLQYDILENLSSGCSTTESGDLTDDYSDSSTESDNKSVKKEKHCNAQKKVNTVTKRRKTAEWRRDNLLRGKLISDSSSDSDSPKTTNFRKRRKVCVFNSESEDMSDIRLDTNEIVKQELDIEEEKGEAPISATKKAESVCSAPIYEVTNISSVSPQSNSDVEFVAPTTTKTDLYVNSDGENASDNDIEGTDDDDAKKGRKNIRKVLADVNLEEETKKANKEEDEHRLRLLKKQKELETWSQTSQSSQVQGLVLDIDDATKKAVITVDPVLSARLKEHQVNGVRFMWDICYESVQRLKESPGAGCILAHCMGLGKTYQVIVLIHTLFTYQVTNTKYALVVCPLSTVLNWVNEFECSLKHVTNKVNVFYIRKQSVDKSKVIKKWLKNTGVLILGYEAYERLIRSDDEDNKKVIEALVDPGPDLIVCDEGHLLKNGKAIRSKALNRVKTRRRIVLTGTPIQNNLREYYYMVDFVKPKLLGTYKEYCNRFVNPITNGQYHDSTPIDIKIMKKRSHVLHKLLRATVQRYEVTELQKHLPKKLDYVIFIRSHPLQAKLYKQYVDNVRSTDLMKAKIFGHSMRLQSILAHPYVLYLKENNDSQSRKTEQKEVEVINLEPTIKEKEPLPSGWWRNFCPEDFKDNIDYGPKFKVMLKIIDECQLVGDKILIFSNSIVEMDAIEYFLKKRTVGKRCWSKGIEYYRLDGTVPPEDRNNLCDSFNNPTNTKAKVFLMSYRVGGLGLNLVAANRVILMDVNWNPSYETQSIFRTYRFGQEKECFVYRLVAMGTIEEVNYQRSVTKLSIAGRVIDEHQITRHYKSAELQEMLRFNLNLDEPRPAQKPPADKILAKLLLEMENEIFKYHEHQALLENRPDEELNEEEMKLAWDEYHQEQIRREEFRKMGLVNVANPPNVGIDYNTAAPANVFNISSDQNSRMKILNSSSTNQSNSGAMFSNGFPSLKMNSLKYILNRNTALNPFHRTTNRVDANQPSTSSVSMQEKIKQIVDQQVKSKRNDFVILNDKGNNMSETNIERQQNQSNLQPNIVQHYLNNDTNLIKELRKEYTKVLNDYQKASKIGLEKRNEIVTPRIEKVFTEAYDRNTVQDIPHSSRSLTNNIEDVVILDIDNDDAVKKLSDRAEISLLPMTTAKDPLSNDDVIEIL